MNAKIGVIVGSTRPTRVGRGVSDWFMQQAADTSDMTFELIDLASVQLPFLNEPASPMLGNYQHKHTQEWGKTIAAYDGYVWVTPEYNHGYSAPLKNAIDSLHKEWGRKPVAFVGYGVMGGVRAVEQLVPVAAQLNMVPIPSATVNIMEPWHAVNADGQVKPELVKGDLPKLLQQLQWWTTVLKPAREAAAS